MPKKTIKTKKSSFNLNFLFVGIGILAFVAFIFVSLRQSATPADIAIVETPSLPAPLYYWPLDELTNFSTLDIASNAVGTITGNVTKTTGNYDGGFKFAGSLASPAYMQVEDPVMPSVFTISLWVKPTVSGTTVSQNLFTYTHDLGAAYQYTNQLSIRKGVFAAYFLTDQGEYWLEGTTPVAANAWYNVALTLDANKKASLYVDGVLESTWQMTGTNFTNGKRFEIGGAGYTLDFFSGVLDELRVYNQALTSDQILTLADTVVPSPSPSIVPSPTASPVTVSYTSLSNHDGWVLESGENTGVGGSINSTATTINVGDDIANKQYKGVVSFNTSAIPDNAIIKSAQLQVKLAGFVGTNPFGTTAILKLLVLDVASGKLGGSTALAIDDFVYTATNVAVASGTIGKTPLANGFHYANIGTTGLAKIAKTGYTQIRLRFQTDDNNNKVADYLKFNSSNATTNMPKLVIKYQLP